MSRTPPPPSSPSVPPRAIPPRAAPPIAPTFPASVTNPTRGRKRRRRMAAAGTAVMLVAVGGVALTHAAAAPGATYRTGTASAQHVDHVLTSVAVLEPVSQATVAFPRSGTVATVDVAAGNRVAAGQTLATLDATELTDAVTTKRAALTTAQTNLAAAYAGNSTGSGSAGSSGAAATSGTASASSAASGASQGAGATAGSAGAGSGTAGSTSATTSATTAASASAASSTSSTSTVTAAQVAALQRAVDVAAAELAVAQQAVTQAAIASPIDGTVLAVELAPGDEITAASTTATIVVVGDGGLEATTTVGIDDLPQVKVGQAATLTPDGDHAALTGKVSSIAVSPETATSSSGSAAYRVSVALDGDTSALGNGSTGTLSIITSSADASVAVPTSAITTDGTQHTVTLFDGTTTKLVQVQVGTVGDTWTQVTSGVTGGQQVVLADLRTPLPSSATASTGTGTNRPGQDGQFGPGAGGSPGGAPPSGAGPR